VASTCADIAAISIPDFPSIETLWRRTEVALYAQVSQERILAQMEPPEAAGNLVVGVLRWQGSELLADVFDVRSPDDSFLIVWWESLQAVPGCVDVGSEGNPIVRVGLSNVHAREANVAPIVQPTIRRVSELGDDRYQWSDPAIGEGSMIVLVLPKGLTVADCAPPPKGAYQWTDRLAVFWKPPAKYGKTARIVFKLKELVGSIPAEARKLTALGATASFNAGVYEEGNVPAHVAASTSTAIRPAQQLAAFLIALLLAILVVVLEILTNVAGVVVAATAGFIAVVLGLFVVGVLAIGGQLKGQQIVSAIGVTTSRSNTTSGG
jgi:hypothetical protein